MESSSGTHLDTEEDVEVKETEDRRVETLLLKPFQCEAACGEAMC